MKMPDYGVPKMKIPTNFLNKHLREVKTGYFVHMWYAIKISSYALLCPITGFIHAFFPWWFPYTPHNIAKRTVAMAEELFEELEKKRALEEKKS